MSSKSAYYYDFRRSCDTEDWSNDAENTALHHRNKLQFTFSHLADAFIQSDLQMRTIEDRIRIESARVRGSNKDGRDVFLADSWRLFWRADLEI